MGNIAATDEMYIPLTGLDGGKLMMHIGNGTLDTALTSELATKLTNIICAIITPEAYSGGPASGQDVYYCDLVISSGRVTIARKADDAGADEFQFILIGEVY